MVTILAFILLLLIAITGVFVVAACARSSQFSQGKEWDLFLTDANVNKQQTPKRPLYVTDPSSQVG